jgi:uncharacterized protein YodC (DUF2158 family)
MFGDNMSFKLGDVVRLKSGGPNMTVQSIAADDDFAVSKNDLTCQWFDDKKVLQSAIFKPETLISEEEANKHIRDFVNRNR